MTSIWYKAKHSKKRNRKHLNKYRSNVVGTTMSAVICCVVGISLINIGVPWGVIPQASQYAQNNAAASADSSSSTKGPAVGSNSGVILEAPKATESDNETAAPATITNYAALPSDSYVANTILVSVGNMQDAQLTLNTLTELGYSANTTINPDDVAAGFIEVQLSDDTNPGIVSDALNVQGIAAQPNFYYYLTDEEEGEDAGEGTASNSSSAANSSTGAGTANNGTGDNAANTGNGSNTPTALSSIIESASNNESSTTAEQGADRSLFAMSEEEENSSSDFIERSLTIQGTSISDLDANKTIDWLTMVGAFNAWDTTTVNHEVTVAVIDSGCNANHEDLKKNIVGMYDTRTGGTSASDITDDAGHGTNVAGIIAAEANNGTGIAGVSYNADLFIIRAMHPVNGKYVAESTDVMKAYQRIFDNESRLNIRVVNMSLGVKRPGSLDADDSLVINRINEAYSMHNILTVVAAGNSYSGVSVPYKCYICDFSDTLLGIINLQKDANGSITRYSGSNYNLAGERTKDLGAPGSNILSTKSNGNYSEMTGTSMASPCAAGIAALVFAANPKLTPSQASSAIYSSATDLMTAGFDPYTGYGCINADKAVQMAKSGKYVSGADSIAKGSSTALKCDGARDWTSDNTAVATVNANGVVTGRGGGYASISAVCNGEKVTKTVAVFDATISGESTVEKGLSSSYSISSTPNGIWTFSSSNTSVATISTSGSLSAKTTGTTTITATLSSNSNVKVSKDVTITNPAPTPSPSSSAKMYRMYNPNSGEHFYTNNNEERSILINAGWSYEGEGWEAPTESSTPVYRLYNPNAGDHHYTLSAYERDSLINAGWIYESVGWYSDDSQTAPLYRQYNPNAVAGAHNYTMSAAERDMLISLGWRDEGIAWYGK